MYVQSNSYNVNMGKKPNPTAVSRWKRFTNRIKQSIIDVFPEKTLSENSRKMEKWKKIEERISRPAENRLIMGATALITQPSIDYFNHKVDEDTRTVSRNRTLAKILAGTAVGIIVRGSSYKIVEKLANIKGKTRFSQSLIPKKFLAKFTSDQKLLTNYKSALSTALAILAMCYTNFKIDAPLTVFLTNRFNENSKKQKLKEVSHG